MRTITNIMIAFLLAGCQGVDSIQTQLQGWNLRVERDLLVAGDSEDATVPIYIYILMSDSGLISNRSQAMAVTEGYLCLSDGVRDFGAIVDRTIAVVYFPISGVSPLIMQSLRARLERPDRSIMEDLLIYYDNAFARAAMNYLGISDLRSIYIVAMLDEPLSARISGGVPVDLRKPSELDGENISVKTLAIYHQVEEQRSREDILLDIEALKKSAFSGEPPRREAEWVRWTKDVLAFFGGVGRIVLPASAIAEITGRIEGTAAPYCGSR